jgi:multiple sugar transport system substrate-binding protein
MKADKHSLYVLLAVVLCVGLLAACSTESGGQGGPDAAGGNTAENDVYSVEAEVEEGQTEVRIAWWGSQTRHDRTLEVIELFEEKNPDIAISAEFTGWDGYWDRLATQSAGQNLPDIIQMDFQYLDEYVSRELLEGLNTHIDSGVLNFDHVEDVYLEGGIIDDELYAVNLGANSMTMIYDPAMFAEAGVEPFEPGYTWDDFITAARQLKENLGEDTYVSVFDGAGGFLHYLRQHDLTMYSEDGTGLGYDDDQYFIDFFSKWQELKDEGVAPGPEIKADIDGLEDELIVHERSPLFAQVWSNQIVALQNAAGREVEMTLLPHLEGGTQGQFLKPSMFFSVTTQSDQPEEAARFIDFITNDLDAN